MQMAAGAGQVGIELRHEGGGHAMPESDLLHGSLEQRCFIGSGERFIHSDSGLVNSRAGFGVKSLDRHAKGSELIEQLQRQLMVLRSAQHAVAKRAGTERRQAAVVLFTHALRRFAKAEKFEFSGKIRFILTCLFDDALQDLARRDSGDVNEIEQEKRRAGLPRDCAKCLEIDARRGIRIAGVPAGHFRIVIQDVADVPAEDDIAKRGLRFCH